MEQYSIFNSENGDRKYLAEDFAEFFLPFFKNGIFDNGLKVVAGTGMQVEIKTGRAFCNGYRYRNKDNSIVKSIAIADGEQSRIDNVVLRLDLTNRTFTCQVVQGSYSNSPVAPTLVRDTTTYDLRLAKVSIPAGITEITDDLITDCRFDSSDCGNVIQAVQTADFTDLFKQFETEFYNWFDDLEVTLDENTATNLTNRVINLENNGAFIGTYTDEDLEDVTDTNECLKDNEGKILDPKVPHLEKKGDVVVLAEEESTSFIAHEIEIDKYSSFILQNKIKETNIIEVSIFLSREQLLASSSSTVHECAWAKIPNDYVSFVYYENGKIYLKNETAYSSTILLGITK